MNPFELLNIPFGFLMKFFYDMFNNYAAAIFFFALVVKIVLLPLGVQQQKSQIKMARIKPKEQAIRSKYAGRTDSATQQKMQSEILAMYKTENYSPMGGCLPLLIQLPILFALYGIIRNPLTYVAPQFDSGLILNIKTYIFENIESLSESVKSLANITKIESLQEMDIIKVLSNPELFSQIRDNVSGFTNYTGDFQNIVNGFKFFGDSLVFSPSELLQAGISVLLLIPVLNFAASFLQTRLTKKINAATMGDAANNGGMKIMEYAMPLLIVWMSYSMYAALGLYWVVQSVLGIAQMLILAKVYPLPKITEEEYELARIQYGTGKKKKKKKPVEVEVIEVEEVDEVGEVGEVENEGDRDGGSDIKSLKTAEIKDEKYISKTIPKGISSNVKNNYKKTGKKYTFKRRK